MYLYYPLYNWKVKRKQVKELSEWSKKGRPVPPPHIVKQRTLETYSARFHLKVLVESGTHYGEMIEAMKGSFDRIYSIELSKKLYEKSRERFKGVKHIELIHGDSGLVLGDLVKKLGQPALYWLDAHYSAGDTARGDKETPIYEEIEHILSSSDRADVIIIDDARSFGTDPSYPTIGELVQFVRSKRTNVDIDVVDDSIRITPKSTTSGQ